MAALLRGNLLRDLTHAISASRECLGPCVDTAIRVSEGKKVDWLFEWLYINMIW